MLHLCSCLTTLPFPSSHHPSKCSPLSNNENFRFLFFPWGKKRWYLFFRITSERVFLWNGGSTNSFFICTHHRISDEIYRKRAFEMFKDKRRKNSSTSTLWIFISFILPNKVIRLSWASRERWKVDKISNLGRWKFHNLTKLEARNWLGAGWFSAFYVCACVCEYMAFERRHIAAEEFEYFFTTSSVQHHSRKMWFSPDVATALIIFTLT